MYKFKTEIYRLKSESKNEYLSVDEETNEFFSSKSKNENNLWKIWKISPKSVGRKVHIKTSVRKMIRGFWKRSEGIDENSEIVVDGSLIEFRKELLIISVYK